MSDQTRQFVIRAATIVLGLLVLIAGALYVQALFEGRAVFPAELQTAIVGTLVLVIGVLGPATAAWISTRASNHNATATQHAVQQATQELKEFHKNGGGDALAEKLKSAVEPIIREGDRRDSTPNDTGERRRVSDGEQLDRR